MKHIKHILSHIRLSLLFAVIFLFFTTSVWAAITSSYYSGADNKKETALRNALYTITASGPSGMSYAGLWTAYATTDVYPSDSVGKAGKIWDMYSNVLFTVSTDQCGSYKKVGDCYNREHSLPKSWFNEATPAYYDLGHIVPTDGYVNNQRSNYAFGECSGGTRLTNGSYRGAGKLGTSTFSGYTTSIGTVFEPDDQYKGDFARMYMYMAVRYKSGNSDNVNLASAGDGQKMFNSTDTNYGLTAYSIALLMKWHRQDPVSQKEIDRNNGMQSVQGNRNPFIDYPCLAEYLWGEHAGETFSLSTAVGSFESGFTPGSSDGCPCAGPTITSPTGTIDIGTTNTSTSIYKDITIQGVNLESGNLTLSITGTNNTYFSLSATSVSKTNAEAGYNVTITYTPTANGSHTATLNISGCGLTSTHTVSLTGTCTTVYTATWMAGGSTFETSTAASGARPDVPASNPTNCSASRVFVGWTATSGYSGNSAPADLFTTTAPTITTNKTFYAVYADATTSGSGTTTYNLASSITAGDQVIIACNTANTTAGALSSQVLGSVSSTFSSDKSTITSLGSGTLIFTVGGTSGAYTLSTSDGALGATAAKKLAFGSGTTTWSITISSGTATITNGTSSYGSMQYNSSSPRFTTYTSGQTSVQLYKVTAGTTTTYDNYSTTCSTGPTVTVTFHANGGTGTMPAQTIPQSTNTTLSTNTFTRDGYSFAGWATTSSGAKVYDDGGTINTSSNIDLYAKWTALSTYTVTWKVNNTTYTTGSPTTSVYSGSGISILPSTPAVPISCAGKTFIGWTATNIGSTPTTTRPADLFTNASSAPVINTNTIFYAVFAEEEASTTTYERVTSLAQLDDADSIVIVNAYASSNFALPTTLTAAATAPTETDGKITNFDSSYKWELTKAGSYWTFGSSSSYLGAASMPTSSSKSADVSLTSSNNTWSITANTYTGNGENCFTIVNSSSSSAGLEYSSGWKLYYATNLNTSWYTLKLYVPAKIGTYVTACSCTYTITATTDDDAKGTVSVTTP